jgi:hypothetical protein
MKRLLIALAASAALTAALAFLGMAETQAQQSPPGASPGMKPDSGTPDTMHRTPRPSAISSCRRSADPTGPDAAASRPAERRAETRPAPADRTSKCRHAKRRHRSPQTERQAQGIAPGQLGPEQIRQIQQALKDQGFYGGAADGVWRAESAAALRRYRAGLAGREGGAEKPGGDWIDRETLSALGLDPARFGQAEAYAASGPTGRRGSGAMPPRTSPGAPPSGTQPGAPGSAPGRPPSSSPGTSPGGTSR